MVEGACPDLLEILDNYETSFGVDILKDLCATTRSRKEDPNTTTLVELSLTRIQRVIAWQTGTSCRPVLARV
jgi:hypothetical protein